MREDIHLKFYTNFQELMKMRLLGNTILVTEPSLYDRVVIASNHTIFDKSFRDYSNSDKYRNELISLMYTKEEDYKMVTSQMNPSNRVNNTYFHIIYVNKNIPNSKVFEHMDKMFARIAYIMFPNEKEGSEDYLYAMRDKYVKLLRSCFLVSIQGNHSEDPKKLFLDDPCGINLRDTRLISGASHESVKKMIERIYIYRKR